MLRKTLCFMLLSCASFLAQAAGQTVVANDAQAGVAALPTKTTAVIFSKKSPNLTVKKAYSLQKAFVKNSVAKGVDIVGFKSGLTSKKSAMAYGLEHPISGVLLNTPLAGSQAVVSSRDTVNLMLEQEFAFRIARPVNEKITAEQLSDYVAAIAPAIEISQVNFASDEFNGLDIIANNALAYKVVIGEWHPADKMRMLDATGVSLSCEGVVLTRGKGANTMHGQAKALLWLINHIIDQGYKIQQDQVLITGNLVKMIPATPCLYKADFGQFGKLDLQITP